jgi:hypothetical protein
MEARNLPQRLLFATCFARLNFCSQLYCGYLAWPTAALKSLQVFPNPLASCLRAYFRSSCVLRLFKVTLDANTPTQHVTVDDRPAPILMQRATGREELETYGNSSPIIHSVFHNSVENQALKMPQGSCLVQLSVENAVEISVEVQKRLQHVRRPLRRPLRGKSVLEARRPILDGDAVGL